MSEQSEVPIPQKELRKMDQMTQAEMLAHAADQLGLDVTAEPTGSLTNEDLRAFLSEVLVRGVNADRDIEARAERHARDPEQGDFMGGLLAQ